MSNDPSTLAAYYLNLGSQLAGVWPADVATIPAIDVLNQIWFEPPLVEETPAPLIKTALVFDQELALSFPGLDGLSVVLAPNGGDSSSFPLLMEAPPGGSPRVQIHDVPIALRFRNDLLRPAQLVPGANGQADRVEPLEGNQPLDITLASVTLSVDFDGGFAIDTDLGIDLPLCLIGDTGVAIEAQNIQIFGMHDTAPPGKQAGWRGVYLPSVKLYLPGELAGAVGNLSLSDAYIGDGGFSGTITDTWQSPLTVKLFGMSLGLKSVGLTFVQNSLTAASIKGVATLPFFDHPIDIEIAPSMNGEFLLSLDSPTGLATLSKPGILDLTVAGMGFSVKDGVFACQISGTLKPLVAGVDWPALEVRELEIDSEGNVRLDGGWLNLPNQYSFDFNGFQMELTKLGFGKTPDGGKWIGLSGAINLVDGLPLGASVDGLRISWYENGDVNLAFDGIGIEFEVPDVLRFKGDVTYKNPAPGEYQFDGAIKLEIMALNLSIDGQLVIGRKAGTSYFAIYLAVDLPAGIPLWATGLGLYGIAGLFAINYVPDKHDDENWYEWYKRGPAGVAELSKWEPQPDSLALGAGITLGTVADNGYTFAGKMLLAIVFPGPVLMIEGKANMLKERAALNGDDPMFRALVVLDCNEGNLLFGMDAHYAVDDSGALLDLQGSAEGFFDFHNADNWYLNIGEKEPREKRIRARLFSLFDAQSYFMINSKSLQTGSWVGYGNSWEFGPVEVTLEAWLETNIAVSWRPVQFHGDMWLHGKVAVSLFGFGISLSVDASVAADVFDPFHILAKLNITIDTPWPLDDIDIDAEIEWGPEPDIPALPQPLQDITVEHLKARVSWPVPRSANAAATPAEIAATGAIPVVPLDARPQLTFRRSVNDTPLIGVNPVPGVAKERIGDPKKNEGPVLVGYALKEVLLERWTGAAWQVEGKASDPVASPSKLSGSWAPIPAYPQPADPNAKPTLGQAKLLISSRTPFDYTRDVGSEWEEWFGDTYDDYPCITLPADDTLCWNVNKQDIPLPIAPTWDCPSQPFGLSWIMPNALSVTDLKAPIGGLGKALLFPGGDQVLNGTAPIEVPNVVSIHLAKPATAVTLKVAALQGVTVTAYGAAETIVATAAGGTSANPTIQISGAGMARLELRSKYPTPHRDTIMLLSICAVVSPTNEDVLIKQTVMQHMQGELAQWSQTGDVLKPHATYRLAVTTTVDAQGEDMLADYQELKTLTEYAYFKTEGPPGLANFGTGATGLEDLTRYVSQTVPPTVAAPGQRPLLPRPVYRGYDVGVAFNENYVDLMYRLASRDLGLYLYDNNNRPARDAYGRLLMMNNLWGAADKVELTASEEQWVTTINQSQCLSFDSGTVKKNVKQQARGQILRADTLYQARMVPLLLHEDFDSYGINTQVFGANGNLGRWKLENTPNAFTPQENWAQWMVQAGGNPQTFHIAQFSALGGDANTVAAPGSYLLWQNMTGLPISEQPSEWTDYRLSAYLRAEADDPASPEAEAMGLVFRYAAATHFYRFSMSAKHGYRRLVRYSNASQFLLASNDLPAGEGYVRNRDYLITIEVIGKDIRVYQDGVLILEAHDEASPLIKGTVGLYCAKNPRTSFRDLRVDDFRPNAPVAYQFAFTTSRYTNVHHHFQSFQDETWAGSLAAGQLPLLNNPYAPAAAPSVNEAGRYEQLADAVFGPRAKQAVPEVQVSRITSDGATKALFVRSPEPIDWSRTTFSLHRTANLMLAPLAPGAFKITDAALAGNDPAAQWLTLLVREPGKLAGHRLEYSVNNAPDEPIWQPYYTFDNVGDLGVPLGGGVRLRVYGAPNQSPPAAPANTIERFAAPIEGAAPLLPATGCHVRLVAPDGTVVHRRTFLPSLAYADVAIKVFRKADGTGLVIVPAGGPLTAATHQLRFTYRRDNQASDPNSIVLSEGGNQSDETVAIDIPWLTQG